MSVSQPDLKALLLKSGNRCAFPSCGVVLFQSGDAIESVVNRSEIAHIVAQSPDGPRGQYPLPREERDKESNLILLCETHHHLIDSKPQYYTVERLRQTKEDHEARIQEATGKTVFGEDNSQQRQQYVKETVYSTLFNVRLPNYVYGAVCGYADASHEEIRKLIVPPADCTEIYPYIVQGQELYAFQDLRQSNSPFRKLVDSNTAQPYPIREWWDDPVKLLWCTDLLNRSLHKLTGRKGLQWDKEHKRYYFQPDEPGKAKEVSYRPLNKSMDTKQVVWQPRSKRTGQPRPYWLHRAVSLRFHRVSSLQWCLSIRPEFRVTKDSINLEAAEKVGSRITRKKSRMYNYDLLGEVNFWRDFLSDSSPRITMNYGQGQCVIISTEMMPTEIEWPGIPEQYAKPFKNVEYAETLFTWAEVANLESDIDSSFDDSEDEDWEEGDEDGE